MAATKRNAGLTSAVPRATLNDEELVRQKQVVPCMISFGATTPQAIHAREKLVFINEIIIRSLYSISRLFN